MPKVRPRQAGGDDGQEAGPLPDAPAAQAALREQEAPESEAVSVRKMKLNAFCADGPARAALLPRIRKLVADMDRVVAEAYLFANFHVLRLLEAGAAAPKVDRNLYYRCLLAVSVSNARQSTLGPEMQASASAFTALRPAGSPPPVDIRDYNQVVADMSIVMATAGTNHLWTNLDARVAGHLKRVHPRLKRQRQRMVAALVTPGVDLAKAFPRCEDEPKEAEARAVVEALRAHLPLTSKARFASRAHETLPLYFHVLRDAERRRDEAREAGRSVRGVGGRLFSLLPTKAGFTASHVPVSSMMLAKLLKLTGLETFAGDGRHLDHGALWRKYFNVRLVEHGQGRRFGNRIVTDGCAVSVLLDVDREAGDGGEGWPASCDLADCRMAWRDRERGAVVGVDPGVTDVVSVARTDGTVASYSAGRFYERAGYNVSRRRTNAWNAETEAEAAALQLTHGPRTARLERLTAYVTAYLAVLPHLLAHRLAKGYRSMRFFRYRTRQAAVAELCDFVAPRDRAVVVGFGDWAGLGSGGSCIRRRCAGPVVELRRALARRPNVLFLNVNEHRTSKVCHGCHAELCNMKARTTPRRGETATKATTATTMTTTTRATRVHKVLHCRNSVGGAPQARCGATWNRDANAAKNILMLAMHALHGWARPAAFCRQIQGHQPMVRGEAAKAARGSTPRAPGASSLS